MGMYKVNFQDNLAISGTSVPIAECHEIKEFGSNGSKTTMNWYIVDAEHETEAIVKANIIVHQKWGRILGMKSKA
jgi:hypothetical protein